MTDLAPRIFVTADPTAKVRAIANVATHPYSPRRNELCVSFDGTTFHTVLFNGRESGPGYYTGTIEQPALNITEVPVAFADGKMTYDGVSYVLDETATIGMIVTKPVMRVIGIVETCAGYYVTAQNLLDGRSHDYLDGAPLKIISGIRARGQENLVADSQYEGHRYVVQGDHMDVTRQTAVFDDQPATILNPEDYEVTFADDLTSVTVTKK